jgi:hypothetical protein
MAAVFGADGLGFGTLAGWNIQNAEDAAESKRRNSLGSTGNETVGSVYDETQNVTTSYKSAAAAAPDIPDLGDVVSGIAVTSISLSTDSEDYATMTLTGHAHAHGTLRKVAHGVTLSSGVGASAFGVTGGESVRSSECTISCEHKDEVDDQGETVAGENYDGKIEISVKVLGTGATSPANYDTISVSGEGSNTEFQFETIKCYKALVLA